MTHGQPGSVPAAGSGWMANRGCVAGSGCSVLRVMVLAPAAVAGVPRRNRGHGPLAIAGCASVGARFCRCPALRLGLRSDGTRHARSNRSAAAIGSGGLLPLRAQPHVRGLRNRVDRTVDHFRARQPSCDCCRASRLPSAYTYSCSFMKSQLCAPSSEQTMKSIAGTCIDGGHFCEAGRRQRNRNWAKLGK